MIKVYMWKIFAVAVIVGILFILACIFIGVRNYWRENKILDAILLVCIPVSIPILLFMAANALGKEIVKADGRWFREYCCREDGKTIGKTKGIAEEKTRIARLMLIDGIPVNSICKYTGLSADEVNVLASQAIKNGN